MKGYVVRVGNTKTSEEWYSYLNKHYLPSSNKKDAHVFRYKKDAVKQADMWTKDYMLAFVEKYIP